MEKIEELIHELKNISSKSINKDFEDGYNGGIRHALELVKEYKASLPKPVEVPEVVARWYELHKRDLEQAIFDLHVDLYQKNLGDRTEFEKWASFSENNPIETLIRMKDGCTVVKEPLYYIELPLEGKTVRYCDQFLDDPKSSFFSSSYTPKKLTEQEIKAIDERYWAFAVSVNETQKLPQEIEVSEYLEEAE